MPRFTCSGGIFSGKRAIAAIRARAAGAAAATAKTAKDNTDRIDRCFPFRVSRKPSSVYVTIYLGSALPRSSSDYGGRDGQPLNALISILLRVGFTGTPPVTGRPVGSYPAFPSLPLARRFISVALSLKSPSPDVIRHPCPVELGLSSPVLFSRRSHLACSKLLGLLSGSCSQRAQ